MKSVYDILNNKLFFDQLLNNIIIRGGLNLSGNLNHHLDKGALSLIGPVGSWRTFNYLARLVSKLNTGFFHTYALYLLRALTLILLLMIIDYNSNLITIALITIILV